MEYPLGLILDRDGVINYNNSAKVLAPYYTLSVDDFEFVDGAIEAITRLEEADFGIVVVTMQNCIMEGIIQPWQIDAIHRYMRTAVDNPRTGMPGIRDVAVCTTNCEEHWPKVRAKYQAGVHMMRKYGMQPETTWWVGDGAAEIEAGALAQCRTIHIPKALAPKIVEATYTAEDLSAAADIILRETKKNG